MQTSIDAAGIETKTFFYRAPGKKHDGKVRTIEVGGQIVVNNYYDVRTGNLTQSKAANGESTFYTYDPKTEANPLLADKPISIHRGNRKDKPKDRLLVAFLKYDSAGRITEQTAASGLVTSYTYNARGQVETIKDPTGKKTIVNYDAFGRTANVSNGTQRQDVDYDDLGRIKFQKMPDGQTVETSYDELGNVAVIKQNGIIINTFDRDPNNRFSIKRDALGRPTWMEYDTRGNLLAEHQPNGSTTWYGYDAMGHRTSQIDGQGNRIDFAFDPAGRMISQTNPLQQSLTWVYDTRGHLTRQTNGVYSTSYDYDDSRRLTSIDYGQPSERLRYRYDEKGRLKSVRTPTNSLGLFYDPQGRIAARQFIRGIANSESGPTSDRVIRYTYNPQGQKTGVVLSEKNLQTDAYRLLQQTQYDYDGEGRLSEIKSNGTPVSKFRYNAKGRLEERTYGNGILGKYTYDSFGRQARLDLSGGPLIEPLLLAYDWDAAGQLKSRTWNGETQIYGYDLSGQLTSVVAAATTPGSTGGSPVESGGSPDSSPQTGSPALPPPTRQFVSNTAPTKPVLLEKYRYDGAGNLLEKFENGLTTILTYDAANQLVTTTSQGSAGASPAVSGAPPKTPSQPDSSAISIITEYRYDPAGRLISEEITQPKSDSLKPKSRIYGFLDKVLVLQKSDGTRLGYDYYPDGQLAAKGPLSSNPQSAIPNPQSKGLGLLKELVGIQAEDDSNLVASKEQRALNPSEELVWEGLALLYRNGETFAIEPHISGGIPVASTRDPQSGTPTYYINDILGTTLAVIHPDRIQIVPLTAFGKPRAATLQASDSSPPAAPTISPENDSSAETKKKKEKP